MSTTATFIGFGEAGRAFAWSGAKAYDRKTAIAGARGEMLAAMAARGVASLADPAELGQEQAVLLLVTPDEALASAHAYGPLIAPGALWFDMNSVAPGTKRLAAETIEAAGGRYVDVAIMAPVEPLRRNVPLLLAGPHTAAAAAYLGALGFTDIAVAGPRIGDASAVKMVRSVFVKGLEAITAECLTAAARAGILDAVVASLSATAATPGWAEQADYDFGRMLSHGQRRAAEMEEAARMLEELGVEPAMTRGTILLQRRLGARTGEPPAGLAAKLAHALPRWNSVREPAA
ncbi:3-hydroxyisobutyrate dehydrogenase-like beta-hydroxyacid dehydrogenase [Sphingopyxis sp. OAS728]|uniref:NAD(P)-dependent oxidoreductase n=1 Tax=Sphingopyxis sp. OAS728 TaxID=2663823 RepID=UPI0017897A5A|nr:DUF1932 domain-containing protein [Sphingopyxis sp. OAS728]MBE1527981.1 3-hydroxyisobutyrate dehydrogenase-like beta-hydroxyacid dehydrogenase [Sphingopyxis sp. OAS728]